MESNVLVALLVLAGAAVAAVVFTIVFVGVPGRKPPDTGHDRTDETGEAKDTADDKADHKVDDGRDVER